MFTEVNYSLSLFSHTYFLKSLIGFLVEKLLQNNINLVALDNLLTAGTLLRSVYYVSLFGF